MSSNQAIPGSYGKPPFSSSPYGATPPSIPNIPPRATGSPANGNNRRGSMTEGGGAGSYSAVATSFRPKSYNPHAASGVTGSAQSHGRNSVDGQANGANNLGEKRQLDKPGNGKELAASVTGVSALSKALEREGVAKVGNGESTKDSASNLSVPLPNQTSATPSIPRIPTPGSEHPPGETPQDHTPAVVPTPTDISEIPEEEKLRILRRHLVSAEERQQASPTPGDGASPGGSHTGSIHAGGSAFSIPAAAGAGGASAVSRASGTKTPDPGASGIARSIRDDSGDTEGTAENGETFPIPYDAPGGDVTHGIYKYQQSSLRAARRASFSAPPVRRNASLDPSLAHIHEPGGFRRQFVINSARERGEQAPRVLKSFVDFLYLYGHFAGEDLDEDEDSDTEDDNVASQYTSPNDASAPAGAVRRSLARGPSALPQHMVNERAPLLGETSRANSKTRVGRRGAQGDASVMQALLMLLKGFVGTGVLFLGKAFFNGDIGGILYGRRMRAVILTSIALSQIGFVAAYTIFVAENLQAFVLAVTNCKTFIATKWLIAAQLVIVLPLSMIRNLAALSSTALIADAFILVGLIYIGTNEVATISRNGVADVALFNQKDFSLLIGTAVFAFEGIGLLIPITEAMKEPQKFPRVLTGCMVFVAMLFTGFGVMGYMAYGSDIQTVVIVNLPQDDKFVQAVQFLYTVAIILSLPLQLFPAVRIMENGLFSKSGKHNPQVKWQKNTFRAMTVLGCSLISWAGASNLDGFVSFIGSFACVPLCFIYPPLLHLKARAKTRTQRALDYGLIAFGVITTVYTSVQTILVLARPAPKEGTEFGKCQPSKK
ncbi:hypothetical protein QFC22_002546 [Naganishia vaughanmartiniae]|uniref:Uncharacterized protein n=1 Tax=Naganishia vaughanmartiniae TaxID=1424756 RepID=A0ACC2XD09_9TREE|nr:hypothetical protein QFC22_002546 [Naganishia vaughanmartiniae]